MEFPDNLKLTFSGSAYSNPIVFENITLGFASVMINSGMTFNPATEIKSGKTSGNIFVKKVNVLSGLTINDGDLIIIDVIPSQAVNEVKWSLFFNPCLTTFDCANCIVDTPRPYEILGSSISVTQIPCGARIGWNLSGCSASQISNSDLYKYVGMGSNVLDPITNSQQVLDQTTTQFTFPLSKNRHLLLPTTQPNGFVADYLGSSPNCGFCQSNQQSPNNCVDINTNYIRYEKSNTGVGGTGIFKMTFDDFNDFATYKSILDQAFLSAINSTAPSCLGVFNLFTPNIAPEYYRYITLFVPRNIDNNSADCGSNMEQLIYNFHLTSIVTTGTTGSQYTIQLTMPTITNGLYYVPNCSDCFSNIQQIVNNINNSSTGTTTTIGKVIDIVTNKGCRYQHPTLWQKLKNLTYISQIIITYYDYFALPKYLNETYMYSGSPLTIIPSLSAQTCDFTGKLVYGIPSDANIPKNGGSLVKQTFATQIITDWNSGPGWENYKIQTTNDYWSFSWFDIYVVVNGVVTYSDPTYII